MTKAKINKAIRYTGLEIMNTRGDGYSYFLDIETGDQVGDSVYACYMNQLSLDEWIKEAEYALSQKGN